MKKLLTTILLVVVLLGAGGFFTPKVAHADCAALFAGIDVNQCVVDILAVTANTAMTAAAWLVSVGGTFLSASINLTLHIKDLYEATPAIELVWITIRDLSSMFIIFMLLYSAIVMIIGADGPKFGDLVVKIFLAGIFINFSLFFTRVAIDASNLVSLQFYRAIAPNSECVGPGCVEKVFNDGGLSNILMQSLQIPRLYDNNGVLKSENPKMGIIIAGIGGVIIMLTAAFSFFAAGIAFAIRIAILMFLLAFSPIFFVGMMFPHFDRGLSKKWKDTLISQCTFMPAYLILMYVALRLLNGDPTAPAGTQGFMSFLSAGSGSSNLYANDGVFNLAQVGIVIQYVIAFLFINAPLVVALELGGDSAKIGAKISQSLASGLRGKVGGIVGRNTIGRLSRGLGKGFDNMAASAQGSALGRGATSVLRGLHISQAVRGTLKKGEESKYGSKYGLPDLKKENEELNKKVAKTRRENRIEGQIKAVTGFTGIRGKINFDTKPTEEQIKQFGKTISELSKKELEAMDFDRLKDPRFVSKLSSKQFDGLIDGDALNDDEKKELKDARKAAVQNALRNDTFDSVKEAVKNLSGKEMSKFEADVLQRPEVVDNLKIAQLKEMEETLDRSVKRTIGDRIRSLPADSNHNARSWINKGDNRRNWS